MQILRLLQTRKRKRLDEAHGGNLQQNSLFQLDMWIRNVVQSIRVLKITLILVDFSLNHTVTICR
jgi:hypothetical protein